MAQHNPASGKITPVSESDDAVHDGPFAVQLAAKICAFRAASVGTRAAAQAHACIADTVGVALAGSQSDCFRILLATPGIGDAPGMSSLCGMVRRTSALDAALINGVASHALDFDDVSAVLGGHPSAPLVAPCFALAEERALSGADVVAAYIVGVETETRLARAVHMHHYDRGWHPTATLGVYGAAAASARLLRLDVPQTATALAMAASLAAGLRANFGTMTKPLHVGQCARHGLLAALLAARDFSANPLALEHDQGFLRVFNGPGTFDTACALDGWGEPLEIESDALTLKRFACCGSAQAAILAALKIVDTRSFCFDDIRRVEIRLPYRYSRHTDRPDPRTPLEAKFSVQYAVARAFANGGVRSQDFEGDAIMEPRVRGLLALTQVIAQPGIADSATHRWSAEVTAVLKNGRHLTTAADGAEAMSADEQRKKFLSCATRVLPEDRARALYKRLCDLSAVGDIRDVTRLWAP